MPMGFGAERANLMGEAAVSMPAADHSTGPSVNERDTTEESKTDGGNSDLTARAYNAKTNLIQEILAFNSQRENMEAQDEDRKDESEQQALVFSVRDPIKVGKVTKYTVTGRDAKGDWTCQRRFNEFEALQKCLNERWPGCYIPAIPEKVALTVDISAMKMQNNDDPEFVEGRRVLLEKFIREISHFEYLIESKEFQIFAHGAGEVTG